MEISVLGCETLKEKKNTSWHGIQGGRSGFIFLPSRRALLPPQALISFSRRKPQPVRNIQACDTNWASATALGRKAAAGTSRCDWVAPTLVWDEIFLPRATKDCGLGWALMAVRFAAGSLTSVSTQYRPAGGFRFCCRARGISCSG